MDADFSITGPSCDIVWDPGNIKKKVIGDRQEKQEKKTNCMLE